LILVLVAAPSRCVSGFSVLTLVSRCAALCYVQYSISGATMSSKQEANLRLINTAEYREGYANSVQIRVSVWDFLLIFGRLQQQTPAEVEIHHFQGIYLSPQQAKALHKILEQNIVQYEKAFGEIKLDSSTQPEGPVN